MITGRINQDRELIAPIRVLDANGYVHRFEAVIDTGFDEELSLPSNLVAPLGMPYSEPSEMVVATGRIFNVTAYEGIAIWRGERRPIRIIEAEGDPLIGIGLLWGSLITAEIIDNGEVTISPLPAETSG